MTRRQNHFNTPLPEANRRIERLAAKHVNPYVLDATAGQLVLEAIVEICSLRDWPLSAAHVRTNHIHVAATSNAPPEQVLSALKARAIDYVVRKQGEPMAVFEARPADLVR